MAAPRNFITKTTAQLLEFLSDLETQQLQAKRVASWGSGDSNTSRQLEDLSKTIALIRSELSWRDPDTYTPKVTRTQMQMYQGGGGNVG